MADTLVDDSPIPCTSGEVQNEDVNNIAPIEGAKDDNIILDATDTGRVDDDGEGAKEDNIILDATDTGTVDDDGENTKDDNIVLDEKEAVADVAESVVPCRPCSVVLHKLTAEEIEKYTTPGAGNYGASYSGTGAEIVSSRSMRMLDNVGDSSLFQEFKKSRKEYLKRKRRRSSETYYGIYSGDEFFYASDEDYVGGRISEEDSQGRKKRRRKKLNYEDDTEWAPPCDWKGTIKYSTRQKKSSKSLRVNTRRKRIESASSESSEDGFYGDAPSIAKTYSTRTKYEPKVDRPPEDALLIESIYNACSLNKDAEDKLHLPIESRSRSKDLPSNPADNDLVTKILKEMADYTSAAKNGVAMAAVSNNEETGDFRYPSAKKPYLKKKRVSRVIRVKDGCSTPVSDVQKLVKDMVNSVCSIEKRRQPLPGDSEKKKCKWCLTLFHSSNPADIHCAICKDVVRIHDKTLNKSKRGRPPGIRSSIKTSPAKSKMIHRVLKNLPKYDKQKIMYSNKANKSSVEKGYNHCKSLTVPKDLKESGSEGPKVKKKGKNKSDGIQPPKPSKGKKKPLPVVTSNMEVLKKNSEVQHRAAQVLKNAAGSNQTHVSLTGIDKGLFLMTFPEPQHGLDLPKSSFESVLKDAPNKQPVTTNNVQYGTYLLPPVPTVVVANYAATDAKSGDYYLSSLYYQNEMTQSKNVAVRSGNVQNNAATNAISLPSMPSMDQISTQTAIPIPQTYQFNSQPNAPLMDSVNMNLASVPHASMCTTESSISELLGNPHLQINPVANQIPEPETSVEALFRNSQLHIEPLPFQMPEMVSNDLLENQLISPDDDAEGSLHIEHQSDDASVMLNQDPETQFSSGDSVSVNTLIETRSTTSNDLNNVSKPASDSNEGTLPIAEPASDTVRMLTEGLDPVQNSCAELDAICIMSVVDLDENPKKTLSRYIESNIKEYERIKSSETQAESKQQKLKAILDNTCVLRIAHAYLDTHGSFTRFSDSLLRRARLLQIKKEAFEQETLSSCQFAKKPKPPSVEEPIRSESVPTAVRIKMENANSCSEEVAPVNIISQIQNQVDNMQNRNSSAATTPMGVVHHFPVPGLSPVSAASRGDLSNESRETPSRGSGPRTPARPESAMSQSEEMQLTPLQIKKERIEASGSPLSQCAYSQNASPQLTAASPGAYPQSAPPPHLATSATQVAGGAMPRLTLPTQMMQTPIVTSIASMGSHASQIQNFVQFQNATAPPNVTVPFSSNPTFQKLLVNVASKQQQRLANLPAGINTGQNTNVIIKNGQVYNVQQVYLPRPPGLQSRLDPQTTASVVNMNHLVFKQSPVTSNSGGTMIVNSSGQGMYPVQNRFSNIPVSQQSQQICNPGSLQQNVQRIANPANQVPPNAGFLMQQNNKISDANAQPMYCAVCNKVATLRCRQCAKVAYCNTVCAKTYWHAKHKMECQPVS